MNIKDTPHNYKCELNKKVNTMAKHHIWFTNPVIYKRSNFLTKIQGNNNNVG